MTLVLIHSWNLIAGRSTSEKFVGKCHIELVHVGLALAKISAESSAARDIGVQDEESWFEALKSFMTVAGSWYTLEHKGYTKRFQPSKWVDLLTKDEEFHQHVLDFMDEVVVQKFDKREGEASDFYEVDKAS